MLRATTPTMQKSLLTIAAALECLAGVALIVLPGITIALLLGAEAHSDGLMIARLTGVALLCLGIACWWARADPGGAARTGTLHAITLYNAGAGLLLVMFAATGEAAGVVLWIGGIFHLGFASAFAACFWRFARTASVPRSM
jgi:hypothetical protein